ncbi:hypothetical protein CVD28_05695 [Bacillus sp. M6-12]|nr:hypothetical protein CVD28_05695 [Bacillus sp. M6-12]
MARNHGGCQPRLWIQLFTRELDRFRKKLTKQEPSQRKRRQLPRLLTTEPHNLGSLHELQLLEEWLSKFPELHELYQPLQGIS